MIMYFVGLTTLITGFFFRIIRRVFIWYFIPVRIIEELLLCLGPKDGHATHSHGEAAEDRVHLKMPKMLAPKQRTTMGSGFGLTSTALKKKGLLPTLPNIVPMPKDPTALPASSNGSEPADASVDPEQKKLWEVEAATEEWWTENSQLTGLHKLNGIRLMLVGEAFLNTVSGLEHTWKETMMNNPKFLTGANVVDVGCGGGIFTEAIAMAGGNVTGVDMLPEVIEVAKHHWDIFHNDDLCPGRKKPDTTVLPPNYVCQSLDKFAAENAGTFDVVVCSEVLEHVNNPADFVVSCCKLARPGGAVVFTTINRTVAALLGAIILPEDVLGLIPRYCHRLYRCVKPTEISTAAAKANCKEVKTSGMMFLPGGLQPRDTRWVQTDYTGMSYAMVLKQSTEVA